MFGFGARRSSAITRMRNAISQIHGSTYDGSTRQLLWFEPDLTTVLQGAGVAPVIGSPARVLLDRGQGLTLGSNLAPALTAANWAGANWTVSNGVASHTVGSTTALSATLGETTAAFSAYQITLIISDATAGTVNVTVDSITSTAGYGNGTSQLVLVTTSASTILSVTPTSDFNGGISSISVRKIAGYHGTANGGSYPLLQIAPNGSYYLELNEETDDYLSLAGPTNGTTEHHIFMGVDMLSSPATQKVWAGAAAANGTRIIKGTSARQLQFQSFVGAVSKTSPLTVSSTTLAVVHGWINSTTVNLQLNGDAVSSAASGGPPDACVYTRAMGGLDSPAGTEKTWQYVNIFIDGKLSSDEISTIMTYIKLKIGASY